MSEDYCKCPITQTRRQQGTHCPTCKKITFFHLQQEIEEQKRPEAESSINESFESALDEPAAKPSRDAEQQLTTTQSITREQPGPSQQETGDETETLIQSPPGSPLIQSPPGSPRFPSVQSHPRASFVQSLPGSPLIGATAVASHSTPLQTPDYISPNLHTNSTARRRQLPRGPPIQYTQTETTSNTR